QPPAAQPQQQTTQQTTPQKPAPKPSKPRTRPRPAKHTTPKPETSEGTTTVAKNSPPPRITVDPGSLPDSNGSVASSVPHSQETDERRTTDQLVQSTEDNLRSITRKL